MGLLNLIVLSCIARSLSVAFRVSIFSTGNSHLKCIPRCRVVATSYSGVAILSRLFFHGDRFPFSFLPVVHSFASLIPFHPLLPQTAFLS